MTKPKTKRGPGRPPSPGERLPLGLRVTKETKRRLDAAARASGRSQSQEAELRLEHTLNDEKSVLDVLELMYGRRWTGLLLMLACAGQLTGTRGVFVSQWNLQGGEDWLADPYAYDQMVRAVNFILEAFRPEGPIQARGEPFGLPAAAMEHLGEGFARSTLEVVAKPAKDLPNDPIIEHIRQRLGDVIGKISVPPDKPTEPSARAPRSR